MKTYKKKWKRPTTCLYIIAIPVDLKAYFKAYCAKRGSTMSEVIKNFMRECTHDAVRTKNKDSEGLV